MITMSIMFHDKNIGIHMEKCAQQEESQTAVPQLMSGGVSVT